MTKTDNEWAAEVMGVEPRMVDCFDDANDFRELLNCRAVCDKVDLGVIVQVIEQAMVDYEGMPHDQPAALKRLREAMEAE